MSRFIQYFSVAGVPVLLWLGLGTWTACQPARSDVMVELADTSYVNQLPQMADSMATAPVQNSPMAMAAGAATGADFFFRKNNRRLRLWYSAQGTVAGMEETINGKLVDSVAFHSNGQRMFSISFDDQGIMNGPARYYYSDGRVRSDGRFANNIKTGIWRHFNTEGRLQNTEEYDQYGLKIR